MNTGKNPAGIQQAWLRRKYGSALVIMATIAQILLGASFAEAAATLTVLHAFSGGLSEDSVPEGQGVNGIIQAGDGNFYGTAAGGGSGAVYNDGCGTIFKIASNGTFTVLHTFTGPDGKSPSGAYDYDVGPPLVQGTDGNLYGGTVSGGIGFNQSSGCYVGSPTGMGTIFRIRPDGTFTTLVFFDGTNGAWPSSLFLAKDGNFYGTTAGGGSQYGDTGYGTVFGMGPEGVLTTLFAFNGTNGSRPSSLLQGKDGNFYGTIDYGGATGLGGVFKMTPAGVVTALASFTDTNSWGLKTLMQASDGNFYGTMFAGGTCSTYYGGGCGYFGTIFKVTPSGSLSTLLKFTGSNGAWPLAPLVEGTDGYLYGSTSQGGPRTDFPGCNCWDHIGTLFRMSLDGKLTTLVFLNYRNGLYPRGALAQASDGTLYGTTFASTNAASPGGGPGEIFRLSIPGAEAPKIISTVNSGSMVTLNWLALRGRSYQLQFTTNLTLINWSNTGNPVTATNTSVSASDTIGSATRRFYRVALLP